MGLECNQVGESIETVVRCPKGKAYGSSELIQSPTWCWLINPEAVDLHERYYFYGVFGYGG